MQQKKCWDKQRFYFFLSFPSEYTSNTSGGAGSYYDPALFGIMGGLALMFIIMCVVLQLFAK